MNWPGQSLVTLSWRSTIGPCQYNRAGIRLLDLPRRTCMTGMAMPQTLHGGPGRAGGGEELAGLAGLRPYLQKVALQGARAELQAIAEKV